MGRRSRNQILDGVNEKVRTRSHHFKKFGFEGKCDRARMEEGLGKSREGEAKEKGAWGDPRSPEGSFPASGTDAREGGLLGRGLWEAECFSEVEAPQGHSVNPCPCDLTSPSASLM